MARSKVIPRGDGVASGAVVLGSAANALKFSVNLSSDVGNDLKRIAFENRVSESSVIEIALRQLFGNVQDETLGTFLRANGACLRRRS